MIDTLPKLYHFLQQISNDNELAIDTEFRRVDSYYPELCLIQIATKSATNCIDILALDDLNTLFDKLYNPQTLWIVHSGRQDIEALFNLSNKLPTKLFDTQIIAGFLGYPLQTSYQMLVIDELGVLLDKSYSRFDWRMRPLPDKVVQYALDDVVYLLKLYDKFKNYQHLLWVLEDCNLLLNKSLYQTDVTNAYKKVKGIGNLKNNQLQLANSLSAYREAQAIKYNKPRKWIFSDNVLLDYANYKKSLPKVIKNDLVILKSITINQYQVPSNTEKQQINEYKTFILKVANQYNLLPEIIANKKTILNHIRHIKPITGWRAEILNKETKCQESRK